MTKRNGSGPKRNRRKTSAQAALRAVADDRPQGFQSDRMRQVWATIDDARAKLEPSPPPAPAGVSSLLRAVLPASVWSLTPCALLARASSMISVVPGVGWLTALFRSDAAS